jgi:hypothetical protein
LADVQIFMLMMSDLGQRLPVCDVFSTHRRTLVKRQYQQMGKRNTISMAKCIGRESNPGLAESIDQNPESNGNGQFYH